MFIWILHQSYKALGQDTTTRPDKDIIVLQLSGYCLTVVPCDTVGRNKCHQHKHKSPPMNSPEIFHGTSLKKTVNFQIPQIFTF
jgi:hypothetical protein